MASTLWLSTKLSQTYTELVEVPVSYELPVGEGFAQSPPPQLEVSLRGTGWRLLGRRLRPASYRLRLDSVAVKEAANARINLLPFAELAFQSSGMSVTGMPNARLQLATEQVATRRVPVRLVSDLTYATGYLNAAAPNVLPDSVVVSGPPTLLDTLSFWPTDTLTLRGLADSVRVELPLAQRAALPSLHVTPRSVTVTAAARPFTEVTLSVPVVLSRGSKPGQRTLQDSVRIFPRSVALTCAVSLDRYSYLSAEDFELVTETLPAPNGAMSARLAVRIARAPEGVRRVRLEPRLVEAYWVKTQP